MSEMQAWQALLARKRLAASSDALKTYGVSSEADVRVLHGSDLSALDMLKPLRRRILRQRVKELHQPDCSAMPTTDIPHGLHESRLLKNHRLSISTICSHRWSCIAIDVAQLGIFDKTLPGARWQASVRLD